jgi:hypothetical protein
MHKPSSEPPAKWTLYGIPVQKGIALGVGAPLYLPTYGSPIWLDPRLFAHDEDEWQAIEYRMPTEPVEVDCACTHANRHPARAGAVCAHRGLDCGAAA